MAEFFEEVEEQLRLDQARTFMQRYAVWVVGVLVAALVVALAVWGFMAWRQSQTAKASQDYAAAVETLTGGDASGAFAKFGEVAKEPSPAYKSLALMQQGGIRINQGKTAEAVALFDEAAKAAPSPVMADAARLKSAFALMDTASYAEIEGRLKPLTEEKRPYRPEAREALALAKLQAGKVKEAHDDFVVLSLSTEGSDGLRDRARAAAALTESGGAANIGAIVAAAKSMLETPQAPVGLAPAGVQ